MPATGRPGAGKRSAAIPGGAGAAGQVGTDLVAKSAPDGYTLLWTVTDGLSVLPAVKASLPYKIPDDFVFIASILQMPFAVSQLSLVHCELRLQLLLDACGA